MTREERIHAAHLAEMRYCLNYLDLHKVEYNPETEEGKRYATALDVLSKPCSIEEKAIATVVCLLNREALHGTIMHFANLIERGHPRHEAAPVVILALEVMCNVEKYADIIEKYNYKNIKKFATDIRLKLSFFVDMIDHFYLFDRSLCEFSNTVNAFVSRESLCGRQISKWIRPISESVVDELEVYYEDDNDIGMNVAKYEAYHQEKRWEFVSQNKRRVIGDYKSAPLYCYSLQIVEEQFLPICTESDDIYHNLGWKLIDDDTEKYNKVIGMILLYFNEADRENHLLNEYQKLQGRNGNMTLVTPLPFAFLHLFEHIFAPFNPTLRRNGLCDSEIYHFHDLVYDFIEKYFYLKGCDDYGICVDMNCLSCTNEYDHDFYHSLPWFTLYQGVSDTEQNTITQADIYIINALKLEKMIVGDYLVMPNTLTTQRSVINNFDFRQPVIGTQTYELFKMKKL